MFQNSFLKMFNGTSDENVPSAKDSIFSRVFGDRFLDELFRDFDENKNIAKTENYDLKEVRGENGSFRKYVFEIPYTPFKKSGIEAAFKDNVLTVSFNAESKTSEPNSSGKNAVEVVHHGISSLSQSYCVSFKESPKIDEEHITAKAEDGMLVIELPVFLSKEYTNDSRKIPIS